MHLNLPCPPCSRCVTATMLTAWLVTRERGLIDGGQAAERSSAATLAEAKGWAERALLVLAVDSLAYDWRGWSYVLAVLAGHLPCPTPAATLRSAQRTT